MPPNNGNQTPDTQAGEVITAPGKLPPANAARNQAKQNRDVIVAEVIDAITLQIDAAVAQGAYEANMTMESIGLKPGPLPGRIRSELVRAGYEVKMRGRDYLLVSWENAGSDPVPAT